jgi:hypothetical protein
MWEILRNLNMRSMKYLLNSVLKPEKNIKKGSERKYRPTPTP